MMKRLAHVTLAALVLAGCKGPEGPQGPPGPPGLSSFYVVDGAIKIVPGSTTDIQTVSCNLGDAATGWAMEGAGVALGPVASGHRTVIPVITGTQPTGFEFKFLCTTGPGCTITNRIICADLTP